MASPSVLGAFHFPLTTMKTAYRIPLLVSLVLLFATVAHANSLTDRVYIRKVTRMLDNIEECHPTYIAFQDEILENNQHPRPASYNGQTETFTIAFDLDHIDLKWALLHECGHILDFDTTYLDHKKEKIFGRPPYVSEYAKENIFEDIAESYVHYKLDLLDPNMYRDKYNYYLNLLGQ